MYLDVNRKSVNGSQREVPMLTIQNDMINVDGYQQFSIINDLLITTSSKINHQLNILKTINIDDSHTIIDIGCSNGYFAFWYLLNHPTKCITFMDHDQECIAVIHKILESMKKLNQAKVLSYNFVSFLQTTETYDTIIMLSIIHWLYSCTTDICCLYEVIKNIRSKNNKTLIIEWVDNEDIAVKDFKHISYNQDKHKSNYNLDNFIDALKINYNEVRFVSYTNNHKSRSIYVCKV
jgi:precorrin-6B methylase 2